MIKVLLSLILVALLSVGGFLLLNQPEQPEPPVEEPPHVHEYVVSVIKPTCTDKGYTMNTCSECGYAHPTVRMNGLDTPKLLATECPKCGVEMEGDDTE